MNKFRTLAYKIRKYVCKSKPKFELEYKTRYVAFLDVLGWKEAVINSENDPDVRARIGFALTEVHHFIDQQDSSNVHIDLQISQFSDCITISVSNGTPIFFEAIRKIIHSFIRMGISIRGSVTRGSLVHTGNVAYGPALVHAYNLERTLAIYPRVIIDINAFGGGVAPAKPDHLITA